MIIKSLKEKYDLALNNFIDKAKKDKHIIAIFLCGSMYEKTLWDKSDIDLLIITDLEVSNHPNPLVENDICFDISVYSRLNFKKALEKSLPDSLLYNKFSNSKLLYSNDDSIKKYHEKFGSIGSIDKEAMLLRYFSTILAM
ncbi:MAG: hypothetical protein GY756_18350, partial [bacterium]|nr:hypothetical protein [bacterium]